MASIFNVKLCGATEHGIRSITLNGRVMTITRDDGTELTVTLPPDDRGVVSGRLDGSVLRLLDAAGGVLASVNLSSLVSAAKADRFLSKVEYVKRNKQLEFTVSADDGSGDTKLQVAVGDLLPVVVQQGGVLSGDGTTDTPLVVDMNAVADYVKGAIHTDNIRLLANDNSLLGYLVKP